MGIKGTVLISIIIRVLFNIQNAIFTLQVMSALICDLVMD